MNNNTQESKIQLEYINKCTELVKEKYEKAPAFFIQNAGCQMNSLQTETVAGIVKRMGYTEVSREEDADVLPHAHWFIRYTNPKPDGLVSYHCLALDKGFRLGIDNR